MRESRSDSIVSSSFLLNPSTSSVFLDSASHSSDEDATLDLAPLLPQHSQSVTTTLKKKRRLSPLHFVLFALASLGTALALWSISPSPSSVIVAKGSLKYTQQFLSDPSTRNQGLIPFPSNYFSPLFTHSPLRPTLSSSSFLSSDCLDAYVSKGELCQEMEGRWYADNQPKLDLVYTWHNGSDPLMSSWKGKVSAKVDPVAWRKERVKRARRLAGAQVLRHFREHDELRYSLRSALASLSPESVRTIHLVVGDTPSHLAAPTLSDIPILFKSNNSTFTSNEHVRLAQTPHWINLSTVEFAEPWANNSSTPVLRIHPHSGLFKLNARSEEEARNWQDSVVPSFNSLAIESQLPNLEFDSSTAIYLNDDFFLNQPLSVSDFESPLTGPIFRMQRDLLVGGVDPNTIDKQVDPESEWKSLGTAAFFLDRRFGVRKRPYLVHVAKTVSTPMLRELQTVLLDELTQTAQARFRGKGPVEAQMMHLLVHYTVEKHREALLYSYLALRSNPSGSGFYSLDDRSTIFSDLTVDDISFESDVYPLPVFAPIRSTLSTLPSLFSRAGLKAPKESAVKFSSADGYAYFDLSNPRRGWPSFAPDTRQREGDTIVCELDLDSCFGTDFFDSTNHSPISVQSTLKRIAFEQPRCGDCLIVKLLGSSGEKGLEAFLPPKEKGSGRVEAERAVTAIGLGGTRLQDISYERLETVNQTRRDLAISLIQRYSYAIAESSASFRSIKYGGEGLSSMLESLSSADETHRPPAFIALNDDLSTTRSSVLQDVDKRLGEWFRSVWRNATKWEQTTGTE
ncbi:uncharacterized protein JCM6883_006974 [Sporobolomyces salmoneus]|uniref:uncharacterized protein n=1 Tax=Sporobolomyces salmoneus TaxID=183962 RepID=UPI00316EE549